MPLTRDRCICLRKFEYSETSQILTLFGRRSGIVKVIAKGAHRRTKVGASKFDGGVDLLDLGDAVFSLSLERDLSTLTEWHQMNGHLELRRSLRVVRLAMYAAELVEAMFEAHDPHEDVFDRVEALIPELATPRIEEVFLHFQIELLKTAGFAPGLSACGQCGSVPDERERLYFSPSRGGIICRNCEGITPDRIEIDPRLIRLMRSLSTLERLPRLTRHQTDPLNRILARHIEHNLSKRLRMPEHVIH